MNGTRVVYPTFVELANGMFMAYTHADTREERLIWMTHGGDVLHDVWVDIPDVAHSSSYGDTVVLAAYSSEVRGDETVFQLSAWQYGPDGGLLHQQPLLSDTLPFGSLIAGRAFDDRNGVLTAAVFVVHALEDPPQYEMRAVRYAGSSRSATVLAHVPLFVPPDSYIDWWAIDDGPEWAESLLLCYHQALPTGGQFAYHAYDNTMSLVGERYVDQPVGQVANGLKILYHTGTVYTAFTSVAGVQELRGSWVSGFPLDEILSTEPRGQLPLTFSIAAYPNPFNSSASIRLQVPTDDPLTIRITDLLGREVAVLADRVSMRGERQFAWDASAQASGIYFCRVSGGEYARTAKLVLLK